MIFFAKLHPLIVHFPVALLTSGVVFEIYGSLKKDEVVEKNDGVPKFIEKKIKSA